MKALVLAILLLASASSAHASKEGILAFSTFRLESNGIGSSGKITVEGKQNDKAQIVALRMSAFGRDYVVPPAKLRQLAELPSNGVRISYEAGYKELGGRTVYIQLQMGFTSDTTKQALVTIAEDGEIVVSEVQETEPDGPANGSRPLRSETKSMSSAAGSRR
jgi:hypothetical protein